MSTIAVTTEMKHNFRQLYADVFWYGILSGSAMAFVTIFAARLGATSFQISLLTAGPAVVNLLISLPAGLWLAGRRMSKVAYYSAMLHRIGYLLLIPLPWLFSDPTQIWVLVLITLAMSLPGAILAISFNSLFAEAVPPDWRGEVVGRRNALVAISMTVSTVLCGQLLDRIAFPLNYQLVFAIGVVGAGFSTYHLSRLRLAAESLASDQRQYEPGDLPPKKRQIRLPGSLQLIRRTSWKEMLRLDLLKTSFGAFMGVYLVFYIFQNLPLPLFPLVFVNELKLTDGMISLGSALFYLAMTLVSLRLGKLSARYQHYQILVAGGLLYGLYPLMIGLAHGQPMYYAASIVGGGVWGVTSASLLNRLMERAPEKERSASMALHNLALNLGVLAGSLAGPLLSHAVGLQEAVLIAAGLRLVAGILLKIWG
jgi:MFS family permease